MALRLARDRGRAGRTIRTRTTRRRRAAKRTRAGHGTRAVKASVGQAGWARTWRRDRSMGIKGCSLQQAPIPRGSMWMRAACLSSPMTGKCAPGMTGGPPSRTPRQGRLSPLSRRTTGRGRTPAMAAGKCACPSHTTTRFTMSTRPSGWTSQARGQMAARRRRRQVASDLHQEKNTEGACVNNSWST